MCLYIDEISSDCAYEYNKIDKQLMIFLNGSKARLNSISSDHNKDIIDFRTV